MTEIARSIDDRYLVSSFATRIREKERDPDDRWTENETHSTLHGLLKEGTSSSSSEYVAGTRRSNDSTKYPKEGETRWMGETNEGEREEKNAGKSLGKKKSGIQARTRGIDGDEINMESVSRKIIVIKGGGGLGPSTVKRHFQDHRWRIITDRDWPTA